MKMLTLKSFTATTNEGRCQYNPGDTLDVNFERAKEAIKQGFLKPVEEPHDIESACLALTTHLRETFPIWCSSPHNKDIAGDSMHMDALRENGDTVALQAIILEIEAMLLKVFADDFSKKHEAVKIHSGTLDEEVWLVSNENVRSHLKAEGLACYLPEELVHLKNNPPAGIKAIHAIKKQFGGTTRPIKSERKT